MTDRHSLNTQVEHALLRPPSPESPMAMAFPDLPGDAGHNKLKQTREREQQAARYYFYVFHQFFAPLMNNQT